jgi:hypothetical protein
VAEHIASAAIVIMVTLIVLTWPRKAKPVEYTERPFLNGTLLEPRRED